MRSFKNNILIILTQHQIIVVWYRYEYENIVLHQQLSIGFIKSPIKCATQQNSYRTQKTFSEGVTITLNKSGCCFVF